VAGYDPDDSSHGRTYRKCIARASFYQPRSVISRSVISVDRVSDRVQWSAGLVSHCSAGRVVGQCGAEGSPVTKRI